MSSLWNALEHLGLAAREEWNLRALKYHGHACGETPSNLPISDFFFILFYFFQSTNVS